MIYHLQGPAHFRGVLARRRHGRPYGCTSGICMSETLWSNWMMATSPTHGDLCVTFWCRGGPWTGFTSAQNNEKKICMDMFFFDGAYNVQKVLQILAASYPSITLFHGAEHILSIFFSDISKSPVIRVRQCYSYKYKFVPYKHKFLHNISNL